MKSKRLKKIFIQTLPCQITLPDFDVKSSSGTILTAESLKSYNSFENPDIIIPRAFEVNVSVEKFTISFPKKNIDNSLIHNKSEIFLINL